MRAEAKINDHNKVRDKIQDVIVDAYDDLNITCYARALVKLEAAVDELKGLAEWERVRAVERASRNMVKAP